MIKAGGTWKGRREGAAKGIGHEQADVRVRQKGLGMNKQT